MYLYLYLLRERENLLSVCVCVCVWFTFKEMYASMGGNINFNNNIIITTNRYAEAGWEVLICILLYNHIFNYLTLSKL